MESCGPRLFPIVEPFLVSLRIGFYWLNVLCAFSWASARGSESRPDVGVGPHDSFNREFGTAFSLGMTGQGQHPNSALFTGTNQLCNRKDARLLSPASGCASV